MSDEQKIPDGPDVREAASAEYPELAPPAGFQPATYEFPPGTPPEVPADFGAARDDQLAGQLTREEIAEFRALRAEKKAKDAAAAAAAEEAAARLQAPTHHVHLADGKVIEGSTIATHWATEDGRLIPVAGVYPKAFAAV